MGEICCTPSPQHQHNNWFHCRLNVWEAEPFSNRQQRWQLSRKRARAFTTYLLSTHAGHKDPSSVTPVNLANRDSTKHALTLSARWKPPPPVFLQTLQSAFTVKPRQITAQLLCYRGSRRKYTVYDPMIWFDTMTHWVQEWSCRHPAARPHAAHKTACQSPVRGGGGDPGRTGRKRSSMPNFLTPTQTHNRLRSSGADHKGLWVAWMEAATCWAHLSWKNMFSVPAAGQQNDGAAEPIKYSLARQRLKSVCWK